MGVTIRAGNSRRPRGFLPAWRPQAKTEVLLAQVDEVLGEYRQHLPLTCRQIFYRLVGAHGYEKTEQAYERLCEALNKARRARRVPFEHIRDDDAPLPRSVGFRDEAQFVGWARWQAEQLRLDRQHYNRPRPFVVVMCEARGMVPQLERVAGMFSVPVLGSGGFDSTTFKHGLSRRAAELGRKVEVLHVGDHDPSGVHVFANMAEDVAAFGAELGGRVAFSRLAVTSAQAIEWGLPTAPRKETDRRRFAGIGADPEATVQAEAVPPDRMAGLLREALARRISSQVLARVEREEAAVRRRLATALADLLPGSSDDAGGAP
jgi:hypothetical protein